MVSTGTKQLFWKYLLIGGLILMSSFVDLTLRTNAHREFMKKVTYYSTDEEALRTVLTEENAFDWRTYFIVGGFDFSHSFHAQRSVFLQRSQQQSLHSGASSVFARHQPATHTSNRQ
ncbi:hypothetical protein E3U43_009364 [Larimichthys crocea]|uniref:Uncharacterized protein n=1 Tax=Larimichthys crocea TaxID=215358 RepID=A0ACD3QAB4_LARCR|nr:hypothetical protein E3U43_009364 [Larimichthys crocea]